MSKPLRPHSTDNTLIYDHAGDRLVVVGDGAPTASAAGYAKGCVYIDQTNGNLYQNTGTSTSATWTPRGLGAQSAALTAADGSTVDTTYGQEEADVISNLVTRLGEVEAALEAAGIVAAN